MHRRVLGSAALTVAVALGTAGCGGANPKPAPVADASPSGSSSSASEKTAAVRAAGEWIEALNSSSESLDAKALRDLSDDSCDACTSIADYITQIGNDGGAITGGKWLNPKFSARRESGRYVVRATLVVEPQQIKESRTASPKRFPGGANTPKQLTLLKSGDRWLVSDLEQEDTL